MSDDPELAALSNVCSVLSGLETESQQRVVDYVIRKFGLAMSRGDDALDRQRNVQKAESAPRQPESQPPNTVDVTDDTDGISPVAIKWMQRNGFTVDQLGHIFSLGVDEIDLVAKSIPGSSMVQKARNVTILKGIAAYLSAGTPRISAEQVKEACLHYDAFDSTNHSKHLNKMSTELSGTKATGYTLTARGLTAGTELIREMLGMGS